MRDEYPDTWVFWLHAGSIARFEADYRLISKWAKIPGREQPDANVFKLIYDWLCDETNGRWIIVIDNADDYQVFRNLDSSLPQVIPPSAHGFVLVTSRNHDVAFRLTGSHSNIVPVPPMDEQHALALLQKKLGASYVEKHATSLARELEYMPLALSQAASYIFQGAPRMTIAKYLQYLEKGDHIRAKMLNKASGDSRRDATASNSVLSTWQISFEFIRRERPSSARLLSLMSQFDRHGIPEQLLLGSYLESFNHDLKTDDSFPQSSAKNGLAVTKSRQASSDIDDSGLEFEDDLRMLMNFLLVTVDVSGDQFEIHALVQLATREWLELHGELESWEDRSVTLMEAAFPISAEETWNTCKVLFPHVRALVTREPEQREPSLAWATVMHNGALYAQDMSYHDVAVEMYTAAVNAKIFHLGRCDGSTLSSWGNLAVVKLDMDQLEEAEKITRAVLHAREKLFGAEHTDTLFSIHALARLLRAKGRFDEAEAVFRRSLALHEKVHGREHWATLNTAQSLGELLEFEANYEEAEALFRYVLEVTERSIGPESVRALNALTAVANMLSLQSKHDEAERLHRCALTGLEAVLGSESGATISATNDLSNTFERQGRLEEAEKLKSQVLEKTRSSVGAEHSRTLIVMANLAILWRKQTRFGEAEQLEKHVLQVRRARLGSEHPDTLQAMEELAHTYRALGRFEEAERLGLEAVEAAQQLLGAENLRTLVSMASLAETYRSQRRLQEAEQLLVRVVETRQRLWGAENVETSISLARLAETYRSQGRFQEAEQLQVRVAKTRQRLLGIEDNETLTILGNLAETYRSMEQLVAAERLQALVLDTTRRVFGPTHPQTLAILRNLAITYWQQGRNAECLRLIDEVDQLGLEATQHPVHARVLHWAELWRQDLEADASEKDSEASEFVQPEIQADPEAIQRQQNQSLAQMQRVSEGQTASMGESVTIPTLTDGLRATIQQTAAERASQAEQDPAEDE